MVNLSSAIFILLLFFNDLGGLLNNKNKNIGITDSNSSKNYIVGKTDVIELGYVETYEKLPKLAFNKITETEFNSYTTENFLITPKFKQNKNYFYIKTKTKNYKFKKDKNNSGNGSEFLGYYPKLKLFALTNNSTTEGLGFGELMLIDGETDYKYRIISIGDASVEKPIPSMNNKYLVYYYNNVYEHKNSFIGVLKVNEKSNPKQFLQEYQSFQSDYFAIEKIIWKDDNIFIVKGFEEKYINQKWIKEYSYYQTTFK